MNTLTKTSTVLASLLTTAVLMTAPAKAEQLVSLEKAVDSFVAQQTQMVSRDVNRTVASNIQQEIANFNMDALYQLDMLTPSVTITDIAKIDNTSVESAEQSAQYSPK